jgi:hypothetical protein
MNSTTCENCKFFNFDSVSCAVNPTHADTWAEAQLLDNHAKKQITINGRKLDECEEFEYLEREEKIYDPENYRRLRRKGLIKGFLVAFLFVASYYLLDNPEFVAIFLPVNPENILLDTDMSKESNLDKILKIITLGICQIGMICGVLHFLSLCLRYSQAQNILNSSDEEIYANYNNFAKAFVFCMGFLPIAINEIFSIALSL